MRISSAFPSQYLRAADLQDRPVRVVMDHVVLEEIGSEQKPILYFRDKEKGLVLNKTNANAIAQRYGDDTDGWTEGEIELFPTVVDFQGKSVDAIRVRIPRAPAVARPAAAAQRSASDRDPPPNDDIPF